MHDYQVTEPQTIIERSGLLPRAVSTGELEGCVNIVWLNSLSNCIFQSKISILL